METVPWSATLTGLVADLLPAASNGSPPDYLKAVDAFRTQRDKFKSELADLSVEDFRRLVPGARETPTHFKWRLFAAPGEEFTVCLHEYKSAATRLSGYTQTAHDHRYAFAALLLSGGYRHTRYRVDDLHGRDGCNLTELSTRHLGPGTSYALAAQDFHSVTEILDGTVSIVVQGSPIHTFSTSVDLVTRRTTRRVPVESRFDMLRALFDGSHGERL